MYLKFVKSNGGVKITVVASKSRVAPTKNVQTVPRLELMGNVILARLILSVINGCRMRLKKVENIYCHTDSQICLSCG